MSTPQLRMLRQRLRQAARRRRAERRGSTLLIVLVLMTMLASLGVIFYVFSAQERASANYYSDGAKVKQFDIDRDTLFDFGMRQLIEGPQPGTFRNSALSQRRHALLPNMLGLEPRGKLDYSPFNGRPFNPVTESAAYNSVNDSEGANTNPPNIQTLANRDPDYTYPDNNNMFLSYDGRDPVEGRRIIIPSFFRPQSPEIVTTYANPRNTWYSTVTGNNVLRPNTSHQYVGTQGPSGSSRYLSDAAAQALWGSNVIGFPVRPPSAGNGTYGERGIFGLKRWKDGIAVAVGDWVIPQTLNYTATNNANDLAYICRSAGTTGSSEPAWPTTPTNTVSDGTVQWECRQLTHGYDVDNDGDGEWEGVWLDLDFPPLEDAAGQLYVPFFSFTVKDADALMNLNVHGNMASVWNADVNLDTSPFRSSTASTAFAFISKSNQGLYPSEVNPLWALNRRAPISGSSVGTYEGAYSTDPFFGTYLGEPVPENWIEAANRDWLYLLMGRYTQSPVNLTAGRWGEEHLLYRAITNTSPLNPRYFSANNAGTSVLQYPWPGPGQTQLDDNGDTNKVTGDWYGSTYQAFGKPLDYTGLGSYWQSASPKQGNYGSAGPARWPLFSRYSSATTNPVQWPNTGMAGTLASGLFNDAGEMVLDGDFKKDEDGLFGPEEMRALFLNGTDFNFTTGGSSRITELAPYNFNPNVANYNTRSSQEFRSKFTTRSWDRKQHSIGYNPNRTWEFNADADGDSTTTNPKREFPPVFGTSIPYQKRYLTDGTTANTDLFRPVLRRLLETEQNNFDQPRYQLRLNLNQLLVGPNGNPEPNVPQNQRPPNIQLQYRPLTPHPDQTTLTATPITPVNYPSNGNFTSGNDQEFWARRDRQLMARDIYALLYTLAWPDGSDPTTMPDSTLDNYRPMMRQFAQYAVNLVDAIDRDDIVTAFEFDVKLNDGWDVDDNPFGSSTGDTGAQRFVVYGVERAGLTLSEAAAVRAESGASNLAFTEWDDTVMDGQHFAYVELRNPGPSRVNFNTRAWRVEVGPDVTSNTIVTGTDFPLVRRVTLRADGVDEGATYVIGSTDHPSGGNNPSVMKVSTSGSAPSGWDTDQTTWIMPNQQPLDLDLQNAAQATNFTLTDASGNAVPTSALYDNALHSKCTTTPLYFRLYRRLSPNRPFPSSSTEEKDNPFVLVDEIAIHHNTVNASANSPPSGPAGKVTFASSDMSTNIIDKLSGLRSRERAQPFSTHTNNGYQFGTVSGAFANTLKANNGNSPGTFTNWQKVYDRDLASVGEMLHVTLGGYSHTYTSGSDADPDDLYNNGISSARAVLPGFATGLDLDASNNYLVLSGDTTDNNSTVPTIPTDAEILFRPTVTPSGSAVTPRWYRLLDAVEVSSKMQATIPGFPNPVDYPRVAGKININMLRHPENFAALLDDPSVMGLAFDEDLNHDGSYNSMTEDLISNMGSFDTFPVLRVQRKDNGTSDDWWQALLASRDGRRVNEIAFTDATTGLYLPGTPESHPFRGFGALVGGATNQNKYEDVEQTLLRSWPGDRYPVNSNDAFRPRQLLELGTLAEHQGSGATALDPYVRSRLLNKVMNNVTTRSNVFAVFMSVKFFRANRNASGAVQIGGPLKPFVNTSGMPSTPPVRTDDGWQPEYRRFFVVDRSQIEKAFDPQTGNFNFRALIEFQQDLN